MTQGRLQVRNGEIIGVLKSDLNGPVTRPTR
jgi:hypothetical protein